MKDKQLEEISNKLNLLAALSMRSNDSSLSMSDRVELLNKFNLSNEDIASIAGTSKKTVEVLKSRIKKRG